MYMGVHMCSFVPLHGGYKTDHRLIPPTSLHVVFGRVVFEHEGRRMFCVGVAFHTSASTCSSLAERGRGQRCMFCNRRVHINTRHPLSRWPSTAGPVSSVRTHFSSPSASANIFVLIGETRPPFKCKCPPTPLGVDSRDAPI